MDLKYDVMESSPGKFWVIVDYTGSFNKCIRFMQTIPCVDRDFIRKCEYDRKIVLRAFPKNGFIPRKVNQYEECHGYSGDWFYDFKTWWNNSGVVGWLANHQQEIIEAQWNSDCVGRVVVEQAELAINSAIAAVDVHNFASRKVLAEPKENTKKKRIRLIRLEK